MLGRWLRPPHCLRSATMVPNTAESVRPRNRDHGSASGARRVMQRQRFGCSRTPMLRETFTEMKNPNVPEEDERGVPKEVTPRGKQRDKTRCMHITKPCYSFEVHISTSVNG